MVLTMSRSIPAMKLRMKTQIRKHTPATAKQTDLPQAARPVCWGGLTGNRDRCPSCGVATHAELHPALMMMMMMMMMPPSPGGYSCWPTPYASPLIRVVAHSGQGEEEDKAGPAQAHEHHAHAQNHLRDPPRRVRVRGGGGRGQEAQWGMQTAGCRMTG